MSRQLRVAFDVSVLRHGLRGGTARYAFHLAEALLRLDAPPRLTLWFGARASAPALDALGRLEALGAGIRRGPAPWRWSPDGAWWLPVAPPLGRVLAEADVFHLGEFALPGRGPAATVATVHDLTTLTHPEHHTALNRAVHARRLRWIERNADGVIAVSEATRADLLRHAAVDAGRIAVVHEARATDAAEAPAAERAAALRRHGLDDARYILAVGTLEPRKNHERLLAAFETLSGDLADVRLVLAGGRGWRDGALRRSLARSPARDRVRALGFVPAAELPALYAGAAVFAFPSLYEGFGLPLLEAMAAGAPILTGSGSSMAEVAGDAAVLVEPTSVPAIRAGLERLLGDAALRDRLVAAGRARERTFSWRRAAGETMAAYERALARRGARGAPARDREAVGASTTPSAARPPDAEDGA